VHLLRYKQEETENQPGEEVEKNYQETYKAISKMQTEII